MTDPQKFTDMIHDVIRFERELTRDTAARVLEMIKVSGPISLMPNEMLPKGGILVMVEPKVYERIRVLSKDAERAGQ